MDNNECYLKSLEILVTLQNHAKSADGLWYGHWVTKEVMEAVNYYKTKAIDQVENK